MVATVKCKGKKGKGVVRSKSHVMEKSERKPSQYAYCYTQDNTKAIQDNYKRRKCWIIG